MNEFEMIHRYFSPLSRDGLRDDAAVLCIPPGHELVVTSDTLNAGTHFPVDARPADIARKALRVNLSDLASCAAQPLSYQMNIAFPGPPSEEFLSAFTQALAADQHEFGIFCSGGDTTRIEGALSISITALGLVPAGCAVRRFNAATGDAIVLSGPVGDALIGLKILRGEIRTGDDAYFTGKYHAPLPRLDLAAFMREQARAAIDISDGLIADLGHLAPHAALRLPAAVFSEPARAVMADGGVTPGALLTGGDDYQLLMAVAPGTALPPGCMVIGEIREGGGLSARDESGRALSFSHKGWMHF